MTTYVVTRKSDGEEVFRFTADQLCDVADYPFAEFDYAALPDPEPDPVDTRMFGGRRRLSKLEFLALLGEDEFKGVLGAATVSIDVAAWVKMIDLATPEPDGTSVNLDDARVAAGLTSLEAAQVLPQGTTARVLHG